MREVGILYWIIGGNGGWGAYNRLLVRQLPSGNGQMSGISKSAGTENGSSLPELGI